MAEVRDLAQKIDYILCLHEGSYIKLADSLNYAAKQPGIKIAGYDNKNEFINQATIKNWHQGKGKDKSKEKITKITNAHAIGLPILLDIDKKIFLEGPHYLFFNHLVNKISNPIDIFRSFKTNRNISRINKFCGMFYFYYPMLNANGDICKSLIYIHTSNLQAFKNNTHLLQVTSFFKFRTVEVEYNGLSMFSKQKLYIIMENSWDLDGITLIIANTHHFYEDLLPLHGIVLSTASLNNLLDPTAAMVYIKPIKYCTDVTEEDIKQARQNIGIYKIDEIRNEISENELNLITTNCLTNYVLQAKSTMLASKVT